MITCPMLSRSIDNKNCNNCMYLSKAKACIYEETDITTFALLKGVPAANVDKEVHKAEHRIHCGLCLSEYLLWVRENVEVTLASECSKELLDSNEVLKALGVLDTELSALAIPQNWENFQTSKGSPLSYRLSHVLFLNDLDYENLLGSLGKGNF